MCRSLAQVCVFLDRDGTIIRDRHYLCNPEGVELLPGAVEGLRALQDAGCALVVLSNQSGVGRGYFDTASVDAVNARMLTLLARHSVQLTGILYCPHSPEAQCSCRKPATGLALEAARRWNLHDSLHSGRCVAVGDKDSDVRLGQNLGGRGVLVLTGKGQEHVASLSASDEAQPIGASVSADCIAEDLPHAARWIIDFWKLHSGQKS